MARSLSAAILAAAMLILAGCQTFDAQGEEGAPAVAAGPTLVMTATPQPAVVSTAQPSATVTASPTSSATPTATVTPSPTASPTATLTPTPAALRIFVRDAANGRPLPGAEVLVYTGAPQPALALADDQGVVEIADASAVTRLTAKLAGYRRADLTPQADLTPLPPSPRIRGEGEEGVAATPTPPLATSPWRGGQGGEVELALSPFQARGIYIPFGLLTRPDRIAELLDLVDRSDLNTLVVDVKSDRAYLAWPSENALAQELGAYLKDVMDLEQLIAECQARDIYLVARIVTFKDDLLGRAHPEWSPQRPNGSIYIDGEGLAWGDPFRPEVRDYNVALAVEVAQMGFDEVQFDYLRFPSDGGVKDLVYAQESTLESRCAAMAEFCAQARDALRLTPAYVSADVFGLTVWVEPGSDMGIGQRVEDIAPHVDYLSPMLYPSTFAKGNLGYDQPLLYPYEVIYRSVLKSKERAPTLVRPWLQHYTLSGVTYGPTQLLLQRQGAEDAASCGWIYWNAAGRYEESILMPGALEALPTRTPTPIATPEETQP